MGKAYCSSKLSNKTVRFLSVREKRHGVPVAQKEGKRGVRKWTMDWKEKGAAQPEEKNGAGGQKPLN